MTAKHEIIDLTSALSIVPPGAEEEPLDAQELALELAAGMLMLDNKGFHFAIVDAPSNVPLAGQAPPRRMALHDADCRLLGAIPLRWEGSVSG